MIDDHCVSGFRLVVRHVPVTHVGGHDVGWPQMRVAISAAAPGHLVIHRACRDSREQILDARAVNRAVGIGLCDPFEPDHGISASLCIVQRNHVALTQATDLVGKARSDTVP